MVNVVLHRALDTLGDVKEALLMMPTLGAHVIGSGIHNLMKRLQLCLQF
jgi:copper homeostasis protein CutC